MWQVDDRTHPVRQEQLAGSHLPDSIFFQSLHDCPPSTGAFSSAPAVPTVPAVSTMPASSAGRVYSLSPMPRSSRISCAIGSTSRIEFRQVNGSQLPCSGSLSSPSVWLSLRVL